MPPRRRKPKVNTTKEIVRTLSPPALVEASSVVPNPPDARITGLDLDIHSSSLETWHPDFAHPQDLGSSPVVFFGQSNSNLGSDWVMVSNGPDHGLTDSLVTFPGLCKSPEQKALTPSAPSSSLRPPELRPKSKSPRPPESQQKLERAPNTKRMSTCDPDVDALLKRTRPDPSQTQPQDYEDGADDDDDESNRGAQSLSFACPYYRLNPVAHQQCLNYTLKRIRDMKQHLARRHYGPTFYCPACHRAFATIKIRDDHIRGRTCESRSSPTNNNLDGVSPTAQELLKQRVDRTVSAEKQWHAVYEILFGKPGTRRVDPYIRSVVRETLSMVRAFLRTTGSKIIPRILDSHATKDKENGSFVNIIHDVFTAVEVEFDNTIESRQMARVTSTRSTGSGTNTPEPTPTHQGLKSEDRNVANHLCFPTTASSGRAGSRRQATPMLKSNTFPGAYDVSSAASSSSSSDLSKSWPSHYLPLLDSSTFGIQQQFENHHGYYVQSSPLDFSTPRTMAGFASASPVFSATPTVWGPAPSLATDYSWNDNEEFLTGIGGSFHDSGFNYSNPTPS
ncbi:hypothetical protein V8F06_006616 [Rhypophila decipiens]